MAASKTTAPMVVDDELIASLLARHSLTELEYKLACYIETRSYILGIRKRAAKGTIDLSALRYFVCNFGICHIVDRILLSRTQGRAAYSALLFGKQYKLTTISKERLARLRVANNKEVDSYHLHKHWPVIHTSTLGAETVWPVGGREEEGSHTRNYPAGTAWAIGMTATINSRRRANLLNWSILQLEAAVDRKKLTLANTIGNP